MSFRVICLSLPLVAMACTPSDEPDPRPVPTEDVVDACGAAELQDLVGQPEATVAAITFAVPVRIIQPGMAVTMDYRADRLNIAIGDDGMISRIYCG
jgi:hypothetical protein